MQLRQKHISIFFLFALLGPRLGLADSIGSLNLKVQYAVICQYTETEYKLEKSDVDHFEISLKLTCDLSKKGFPDFGQRTTIRIDNLESVKQKEIMTFFDSLLPNQKIQIQIQQSVDENFSLNPLLVKRIVSETNVEQMAGSRYFYALESDGIVITVQ